MVKIWIHRRGGDDPVLVADMSLDDTVRQFDLAESRFLQPLGETSPTPAEPGPLGDDLDPRLVVFEVFPEEGTASIEPGYYASGMKSDMVVELLTED